MKLTDDKEAYAWMVYDDIDDIDYGSNIDNDLFSQVSLYKDNAKYKIGGYYNYDKEAYAWMVYDDIDDIDYGSNIDNDLFSQVSLYKDNAKYKIGGYYNYLYDMDPGSTLNDTQSRAEDFGFEFFEKENNIGFSTLNDTQSRAEDFGFEFFEKENNIGFSYDEKNGDKFRKLGLWERDPKLDSLLKFNTLLGGNLYYNYNPSMIRES